MKRWTEKEIARLKAMYPHTSGSQCAKRLGVSHAAVRKMASRLKLRKSQECLVEARKAVGRKVHLKAVRRRKGL